MAPHCAAGTDSVVVVLIGRRSRSRAPRHRARGTVGAVAPLGLVDALGTVETVGTGSVVVGVAGTPEAARSPQCEARADSVVVLIRRRPRGRVPRHRALGPLGADGADGADGAVGTGSVVSDRCVTGRRMSCTAEATRTAPAVTAHRTPQPHKPRTAEATRTTPVVTTCRTPQPHKPRTAEATRTTPVATARRTPQPHKPRTAEGTRRALLLIGAAPSGSRGS
ncbi:hypothetical protein [Streptomyces sp. NBC_00063]|uniref:hypothetical protein n=1 Tax=Streptomyces sp. NBC_00063 TaxID=2975638 RepID=UPI003D72FD3C